VKKTLAVLLAILPLLAAAADYQQGKDYTAVQNAAANPDPKTIKVEEFFWYGCPHCYALEPSLEKWVARLPKTVTFVRVPNTLGRDVGVLHSKTFYAAESMNILDKVHKPIFDALHADPGSLVSADAMAGFVSKTAGVPAAAFTETLNSFFVDNEVRQAQQQGQDYGVSGTPTLVVDGRWLVSAKQPPEDMLKVADFLIDKIRKERNLADAPAKEPKKKKKPAAP